MEESKQNSGVNAAGRANQTFLTVSQLTQLLNDLLEASQPLVIFTGEISQLQVAQSGHIYFTVKDERSQVSCVMWAGMAKQLTFTPAAGVVVQCFGRPTIYGPTGRFQIVVNRMMPAGAGEVQRKFLELKARLEREGFFAAERKRDIPSFPRTIGIVTSKTGAVIHDMMVKIKERMPSTVVYLADTRVQGEGAAIEIAEAITRMSKSGLVEVIIVARGGGSLEDLWAFNEELVVKAIFGSLVPVISGVGHEVDITLSDLVADLRAPTPTAAAEMVVPHRNELLLRVKELERRLRDYDRWFQIRVQRVDELTMRLSRNTLSLVEQSRLRVSTAEARVRSMKPERVIDLYRERVRSSRDRLLKAGIQTISENSQKIDRISKALRSSLPPSRIQLLATQVARFQARLDGSAASTLQKVQFKTANLAERLEGVSPRRVLERGYAVVRNKGSVVKSVGAVALGDELAVTLLDGTLDTKVIEVKNG